MVIVFLRTSLVQCVCLVSDLGEVTVGLRAAYKDHWAVQGLRLRVEGNIRACLTDFIGTSS